ncbi:MAG TPA: nicotinamide riboside transporter PnuC [Flavisolibacter sp.]|nr:nicotinamide riboside transporter PnuC [Flavisolibacter sp.]
MQDFFRQFLSALQDTSLLEYIAVVSGIASVWLSRKENILVYPVGLPGTIIYVYLSAKADLYGEASVNLYYTLASIYGWILWSRRNGQDEQLLQITKSSAVGWRNQLIFFLLFYVAIYCALVFLKHAFYSNTIPWADAFASATAYTGMWLMARKKVESWYWWLATDLASVPLYYHKGFALTSVYYFILFLMALSGLAEWKKKAGRAMAT